MSADDLNSPRVLDEAHPKSPCVKDDDDLRFQSPPEDDTINFQDSSLHILQLNAVAKQDVPSLKATPAMSPSPALQIMQEENNSNDSSTSDSISFQAEISTLPLKDNKTQNVSFSNATKAMAAMAADLHSVLSHQSIHSTSNENQHKRHLRSRKGTPCSKKNKRNQKENSKTGTSGKENNGCSLPCFRNEIPNITRTTDAASFPSVSLFGSSEEAQAEKQGKGEDFTPDMNYKDIDEDENEEDDYDDLFSSSMSSSIHEPDTVNHWKALIAKTNQNQDKLRETYWEFCYGRNNAKKTSAAPFERPPLPKRNSNNHVSLPSRSCLSKKESSNQKPASIDEQTFVFSSTVSSNPSTFQTPKRTSDWGMNSVISADARSTIVQFAPSSAAEFDKDEPVHRSLTPLPPKDAAERFPTAIQEISDEELQESEETKRNSELLAQFDFDLDEDDQIYGQCPKQVKKGSSRRRKSRGGRRESFYQSLNPQNGSLLGNLDDERMSLEDTRLSIESNSDNRAVSDDTDCGAEMNKIDIRTSDDSLSGFANLTVQSPQEESSFLLPCCSFSPPEENSLYSDVPSPMIVSSDETIDELTATTNCSQECVVSDETKALDIQIHLAKTQDFFEKLSSGSSFRDDVLDRMGMWEILEILEACHSSSLKQCDHDSISDGEINWIARFTSLPKCIEPLLLRGIGTLRGHSTLLRSCIPDSSPEGKNRVEEISSEVSLLTFQQSHASNCWDTLERNVLDTLLFSIDVEVCSELDQALESLEDANKSLSQLEKIHNIQSEKMEFFINSEVEELAIIEKQLYVALENKARLIECQSQLEKYSTADSSLTWQATQNLLSFEDFFENAASETISVSFKPFLENLNVFVNCGQLGVISKIDVYDEVEDASCDVEKKSNRVYIEYFRYLLMNGIKLHFNTIDDSANYFVNPYSYDYQEILNFRIFFDRLQNATLDLSHLAELYNVTANKTNRELEVIIALPNNSTVKAVYSTIDNIDRIFSSRPSSILLFHNDGCNEDTSSGEDLTSEHTAMASLTPLQSLCQQILCRAIEK